MVLFLASSVVDLLVELVRFKTVNDPVRGVKPGRECVDFIQSVLGDWGISSRIVEVDGYYSVYGLLGEGEPRILLQAHYDVVPVDPSEWSSDPFDPVIQEGRVYGRGAADDKSNVAAIMAALRELAGFVDSEGGSIVFAFTGDEEVGGRRGAGFIAELLDREGLTPHYVVNGDGFGLKPIVRRRSALRAEVKVRRKTISIRGSLGEYIFRASTPVVGTRHAAYFMPGVDTHPVIAASHFIRSLGDAYAVELGGSFIKSNVVPGEAVLKYVVGSSSASSSVEADYGLTVLLKSIVPLVRAPLPVDGYSDYGVSITPNVYSLEGEWHTLVLDIRAMVMREDTIRRLEGVLRGVLDENISGSVEYRLSVYGRPSYLYTPVSSEIVGAFRRVYSALGLSFGVLEGAGVSDSRYYSTRGIEVVDLGPIGGNVHGPNEWVDIESLRLLSRVYVGVVEELVRTWRSSSR